MGIRQIESSEIGVETDKLTKKDAASAAEKYWDAPEVAEIAKQLMSKDGTFVFPTNTPILYVFADKIKNKLGKCQHCSELHRIASGYQFYIVINHAAWQLLTAKQREALVFHELCHVGYDAVTDKYSIVEHDLEEFGRVVKRYGLWQDDVKVFGDALLEAITLDEAKKGD